MSLNLEITRRERVKMITKDGVWFVETRNQRIEGGGRCETTERVRVLGREGTRRIIEAIVLTDKDTDRSKNVSIDRGKGYHYIALMEGKNQLSFAIDFRKAGFGWRVLSNNGTSFVQDVKTKKAAIELLTTASKAEKVKIADQTWRQEPVPSEAEVRAEQAADEAADKRDAEIQEAEQ